MAKFTVRRPDVGRTFHASTGSLHVFQLGAMARHVVEMDDAHFNHDSAVMLPDFGPCSPNEPPASRITGIAVLAAALDFAGDHPDKKVLLSGHTDTSGPDDYNLSLSQKRADGVLAALTGDRDGWVRIADDHHKVEDYQQILRWVASMWGWPCDPGAVDGDHGSDTDAAVERFQRMASSAFERELSVDGDVGPQTWGAFFDAYMSMLADVMGLDAEGLSERQRALKFVEPKAVGCGENFPVEGKGTQGLRSETNRRVEIVFFDPGEEPKLQCHARTGTCDPARCDLHAPLTYEPTYLPCPPLRLDPVVLQTSITEVLGLYQPGHEDPDDRAAGTTRASGYRPGYKSEDDAGRIFVNHVPRPDASTSWDDIRRKDTQYIELTVSVTASGGRIPAGTRVQWTWEDPDDPSNEAMHLHASGLVDPGDSGLPEGDDNLGERDHPSPAADSGCAFEALESYGLEEVDDAHVATTAIVDGISKVRLHCTNVAGDNLSVGASLSAHQLVVPESGDSTGLMTMWKRIDVEYRKMEGALDLPVDEVPRYFEPCFVQMDIGEPQSIPRQDFLADTDDQTSDVASNFVKAPPQGVFANESKPGWFLLVAAHRAARDVGTATRTMVYEGPATVDDVHFSDGDRAERIIVDQPIAEDIGGVLLVEGSNELFIPVWAKDEDTPAPGKTALYLYTLDLQSDFEPYDGKISGPRSAYAIRDNYYPRHLMKEPSRQWVAGGLGFPETVQVKVYTKGGYETGGISPSNTHRGTEYFAGRTIIFTGHPGYSDNGVLKRDKVLGTLVHEFGHAFGFPHKCGYYTWEDPPAKSCSMNYFNTWLYTPGTRNLQRFVTGDRGAHFCARHLHGIRRVHLEDNPSLWRWS